MREALISAQRRAETGSGNCRKLRGQGRIPAIVYGHGKSARSISLDQLEFSRFLADNPTNAIVRLSSEDEEIKGSIVMVKEVQRNPVRGSIVHVDLQEISLSDKVTVSVPVSIAGRIADDSGILEHVLSEVTVEAVATEIPAQLVVDVTGLEIGGSKRVSDLELPEGVRVVDDADEVVVRVSAPRTAEEDLEPAEGAEDVETTETGTEAEGDEAE